MLNNKAITKAMNTVLWTWTLSNCSTPRLANNFHKISTQAYLVNLMSRLVRHPNSMIKSTLTCNKISFNLSIRAILTERSIINNMPLWSRNCKWRTNTIASKRNTKATNNSTRGGPLWIIIRCSQPKHQICLHLMLLTPVRRTKAWQNLDIVLKKHKFPCTPARSRLVQELAIHMASNSLVRSNSCNAVSTGRLHYL